MLVVTCNNCGCSGPFMCTGKFMVHPPMPTVASPSGAPCCPMCGVVPAVFVCSQCLARQPLHVQGSPTSPPSPATAPKGAGDHKVRDFFTSLAKAAAESFVDEMANELGNDAGEWMGQQF